MQISQSGSANLTSWHSTRKLALVALGELPHPMYVCQAYVYSWKHSKTGIEKNPHLHTTVLFWLNTRSYAKQAKAMEDSKLQALHDSISKLTKGRNGLGTSRVYSWQKQNGINNAHYNPEARGLPNNALYSNFVPAGIYDPNSKPANHGDGRYIKRNFDDDDEGKEKTKEERKAEKKAAAKAAKLEAKRQAKLEEKRQLKRKRKSEGEKENETIVGEKKKKNSKTASSDNVKKDCDSDDGTKNKKTKSPKKRKRDKEEQITETSVESRDVPHEEQPQNRDGKKQQKVSKSKQTKVPSSTTESRNKKEKKSKKKKKDRS